MLLGFRIHLIYLTTLILALLFMGCDQGVLRHCSGELIKINEAKVKAERIKVSTTLPPKPFLSPVVLPSTREAGCSDRREFVRMQLLNEEVLIFVDVNSTTHHSSGESWQRPSKSLVAAIKTAVDIRQKELEKGQSPKPINIIVASGTYSLDSENEALKFAAEKQLLAETSSIISLDGFDSRFFRNIKILGGYRSSDPCFGMDDNIRLSNTGRAGRITTLDGQGKSNSVVVIAANAKNIEISRFTIQGGKALGIDALQAEDYKKFGGGVLVRTNVQGAIFSDITINGSEAQEGGGCLAIVGDASTGAPDDITFDNLKLNGCKAQNGGGVFIGGQAKDINAKDMQISSNIATLSGGGMMIAEDANNIKFSTSKVDESFIKDNTAENGGGGVAIIGNNVKSVTFNGIVFAANKIVDANNNGVGILLNGPKYISLSGGKIIDHAGGENGAGLYAENVTGLQLTNKLEIANNSATDSGGGAYIENCINVNLTDANFLKNSANNGGGLSIHSSHVGAHQNVTYTENTTQEQGGAFDMNRSMDSSLSKASQPFPMNNITCTQNTAKERGGCGCIAFAPNTEIKGGRFSSNGHPESGGGEATKEGGAIYYLSASLVNDPPKDIDNDAKLTIKTDTAFGKPSFYSNQAQSKGAAIFTNQVFHLEINKADFVDNQVLNGQGGAVFTQAAEDVAKASKLENQTGVRVILTNVLAQSNGAKAGGAFYLGDKVRVLEVSQTSILEKNTASGGHGGGIYVGFTVPVKHVPDTSDESSITSGAVAKFNENTASSTGGAIFILKAPQKLYLKSDFNKNEAYSGGAVSILGDQAITLADISSPVSFTENEAKQGYGGGLFIGDNVVINGLSPISGKFVKNKAKDTGGVIAIMGQLPADAFKTNGATFDENQAAKDPAIHIAKIPLQGFEFTNTNFNKHKRTNSGCGGLMDLSEAIIDELKFDNSTLSKNTNTAGNGGAFCVKEINHLAINSSLIKSNSASLGGGVFFVKKINDSLTIQSSRIYNNSSEGNGGFLNIEDPSYLAVNIDSLDAIGNQAKNGNGGLLYLTQANSITIKNDPNTIYNLLNASMIRASGQRTLKKPKFLHYPFPSREDFERLSDEERQQLISRSREVEEVPNPDYHPEHENVSKIAGNYAANDGGAIFVGAIENVTISDEAILNNIASRNGGFLNVNILNGSLSINEAIIYKNSAANGGAVYVEAANQVTVDANRRYLDKESSESEFIAQNPLPIAKALLTNKFDSLNDKNLSFDTRGMFLIEKNDAINNGGVFYFGKISNLVIDKIAFAENKAADGGAVFIEELAGAANVKDSFIYKGEPAGKSGGIKIKNGPEPKVTGSTVP